VLSAEHRDVNQIGVLQDAEVLENRHPTGLQPFD
jgi:hypothetical protein